MSIDSLIGYEGTVTKKVTVEVKLTVSDWQLFDDKEGVTAAANALNEAATEGLSSGDPLLACRIFEKAQQKWMAFGAWDTEASGVFHDLYVDVFSYAEWDQYR